MRYRVADAKIKNNSKSSLDSSFHQPVDSDNFMLTTFIKSIYSGIWLIEFVNILISKK
jgi:hypothetical protein